MTDQRAAIAGVFDRASETYDSVGVEFFSRVGRDLVGLATLRPGDRVVDAGCGRGAVALPAAEAVGPAGSVLAFDLAPGMVERLAADAAARGLSQVRTAVMDAQEPELEPAAFDAVLSSLVVFFLPDPATGLRAWRAATRDGGRLALSTFVGRDDERWSWLAELFPERNPRMTTVSGEEEASPFSSDERLHALLASVGWLAATSIPRSYDVVFAEPEQWLAWSWSHGMRTFWERTPEDRRDEVRAEARRRLAGMQKEHGSLELRMELRLTTATAG